MATVPINRWTELIDDTEYKIYNKFCNFLAIDHNCSYSYVQKTIVSLFNKKELEQLNNKLINISLELIQE